MTPNCSFCGGQIFSCDKHILDDHWYHELCWWKHECARLTQVVADMKEARDSGTSDPDDDRHAQHDLGSEPTVIVRQSNAYTEDT